MNKICNTCDIDQSLENFGICKRNKDGRLSKCKNCKKEYDINYYSKNIDKRRLQKKVNQEAIRDRNSQFVWNFLKKIHVLIAENLIL